MANRSFRESFFEFIHNSNFEGQFDFIVGIDVLDKTSCSWLLKKLKPLLREGGEIVFLKVT